MYLVITHFIMDNLDMRILSSLLDNCRESDRGMGMRLGVSGGAIRARRQKMQDAGIIQRYVTRVEPPLLGLGVLYVVVTGEDADEILQQCRLIGKPYLVVPCVGGVTVCGVVVDTREMQQKIQLARGLMKGLRILSIFEAGSARHLGRLTRTDLEVLERLASSPRQQGDAIAKETGLSTKTVARCRDKFHADPGIQFTLAYDPQMLKGYIPYAVIAWTGSDPSDAVRVLDERFSRHYLQAPFVADSQVVLFMYCKTIFEMDDITQRVRKTDMIDAADLFIPKRITFYDQWLHDAIAELKKSPRLHLGQPSLAQESPPPQQPSH